MSMFKGLRYCVVGSGFSGSVIAERIARVLNEKVLVLEKRSHIGGNSYSEIDTETGIEAHKYGSHIFHTRLKHVWQYLRNFGEFSTYQHKVLALHNNRIYYMPINLKTINDLLGSNFNPLEAQHFIQQEISEAGITNPSNLEEKAVSLLGTTLYKAFIRDYTMKQWGTSPTLLPADIISRLPVRYNYNVNYFSDPYQGIPLEGYGTLLDRILSHQNIEVRTNTAYEDISCHLPSDCKVVYTGMIDHLFDYRLGCLEWRSLRFEWERIPVSDFQGNSVVNYSDNTHAFTRIHEFKHYHSERKEAFESQNTIICREYPHAWQPDHEAYYPVNSDKNNALYAKYLELLSTRPNLYVAGRLGNYRYWDMDQAVDNSLKLFDLIKKS